MAITLSLSAQAFAPVQFGDLTMQWLDGYVQTPSRGPFLLTGPKGQEVSASVFSVGNWNSPSGREAEFRKLVAYGSNQLDLQARNAGTPVLPLGQEQLPDGSTFLFTGSEQRGQGPASYTLIYFLISPGGRVAYMTIAGKGSVPAEHERFRPLFQTIDWIH